MGKTASLILAAVAASTLTVSVSTSQAQAGRPNQTDYFSTGGHSVPAAKPQQAQQDSKYPKNTDPLAGRQGAGALYSDKTPQLDWFETFDEFQWTLLPSEADRAVLSRPLNQELERVQDYIKTSARIAKNYRLLAVNIRKLPVPANSPGLKDYQKLRADFFDDIATVYEDLIRPRRTRTQEELQEQLREIEERSNQLKVQNNNLLTMDSDLRRTFRVHAPKRTDALRRYVENK
ncbi:MAG TPA: hypothetical protein PKZ32_13605 [Candidatus Melainabacteria bacterium]|nr:hypothetical protein [Candidatus Melainabacteria bacterium]